MGSRVCLPTRFSSESTAHQTARENSPGHAAPAAHSARPRPGHHEAAPNQTGLDFTFANRLFATGAKLLHVAGAETSYKKHPVGAYLISANFFSAHGPLRSCMRATPHGDLQCVIPSPLKRFSRSRVSSGNNCRSHSAHASTPSHRWRSEPPWTNQ